MAKCRGCGASIVWLQTASGKMIPCDPELVTYWERAKAPGKVITPNGEVISCVFEGDPQGMFYRCLGRCSLPSAPKYIIVGDCPKLPFWCPRYLEQEDQE